MKHMVSGFVCLALAAGVSFVASAVVGPTSASYAGRSDMIAQWDGIDNAGTGAHVAGATIWKDLVGSRDLALGGGAAFAEGNCLKRMKKPTATDSRMAYFTEGVTGVKTIEVVIRRNADQMDCRKNVVLSLAGYTGYDANGKGVLALTYLSDDEAVHLVGAASTGYYRAEDAYAGAFTTFSSVLDGGAMYGNGATLTPDTWPEGWSSNMTGPLAVGGRENGPGNCFLGRIYAVRLYNRALTAEEIALNAKIDQNRFLGDFFTVDSVPLQSYAGTPCEPVPVIRDKVTGEVIDGGAFALSYADNDKVGTATLTVTAGSATICPGRSVSVPFEVRVLGTAAGYVREGLVHFWDGINNSWTGAHDSTATTWIDLAGTLHLTIGGGAVFSNANCLARGDEKAPSASSMAEDSRMAYGDVPVKGVKTLEVVLRRKMPNLAEKAFVLSFDSDYNKSVFGMKNDNDSRGAFGNNNAGYMRCSDVVWEGTSATFALTLGSKGLYRDGLAATVANVAAEGWSDPSPNFAIGGRPAKTVNCFGGEIFAVRLYNRELTEKEIAQNAMIDRFRFFGAERVLFDFSGVPVQLYNASIGPCRPVPRIIDGATGEALNPADFTFAYADNDRPGTAKVTVTANPGSPAAQAGVGSATAEFQIRAICRVSNGATDAGSGNSWDDAMTWTNALTTVAKFGGEIWIRGETVRMTSAVVSRTFAAPVAIRGGFAGTESVASERPARTQSVLDGEGSYAPLKFENSAAVEIERVRFVRSSGIGLQKFGEGDLSIADCGFIRNGLNGTWGDTSEHWDGSSGGAGVRLLGGAATKLSVRNCTFEGNTTKDNAPDINGGGGAFVGGFKEALFTDCSFVTNHPSASNTGVGGFGCAVYVYETPTVFSNCTFVGNHSTGASANIVTVRRAPDCVFDHCAFVGNSVRAANGDGRGVVYCNELYPSDKTWFRHCTFAYNIVGAKTALFARNGDVRISDSIFYGNSADGTSLGGADLFAGGWYDPKGAMTPLSGQGKATVRYSLFGGEGTNYVMASTNASCEAVLGEGCVSGDPLFRTTTARFLDFVGAASLPQSGGEFPSFASRLKLDVRLRRGSPAINAGDPAADYSREPEPNGHRVDMGVYGNTPLATKLGGLVLILK